MALVEDNIGILIGYMGVFEEKTYKLSGIL